MRAVVVRCSSTPTHPCDDLGAHQLADWDCVNMTGHFYSASNASVLSLKSFCAQRREINKSNRSHNGGLPNSDVRVYNSTYDVLNAKKRPIKSLGKLWSLLLKTISHYFVVRLGIPPSVCQLKQGINMIVAVMAAARQVAVQNTYVPKMVEGDTSYSQIIYSLFSGVAEVRHG